MNWFPFPFPKLWQHRLIFVAVTFVAGMTLVGIGAATGGFRSARSGPASYPHATVTVHATVTRTPKPALPASCKAFTDYALKLYGAIDTFEDNYGNLSDLLSLAASGLEANDTTVLNNARANLTGLDKTASDNLNTIITLYQEASISQTQCKGDTHQ